MFCHMKSLKSHLVTVFFKEFSILTKKIYIEKQIWQLKTCFNDFLKLF